MPAPEQRVANHNAGHGVGGVGEPLGRTDIARGIDPAIGRPQEVIDQHPLVQIARDSRLLQPQPLDVRYSPRRNQDLIAVNPLFPRPARHNQCVSPNRRSTGGGPRGISWQRINSRRLDPQRHDPQPQVNSIPSE